MADNWKDRSVGSEIVDADQLLGNEKNPRIHPKYQQDVVTDVLNKIGWVKDVIVNKRTSPEWGVDQNVETILDGHLRVMLAISKGAKVPVKYVDLLPHEESLALSTLDPSAELAGYDAAQLDALLREVNSDSPAIQQMLSELADKSGLAYTQVDPPEEFKSFDENIETEHCCPKCGYRWSGKIDAEVE